MGCGNSKHEQVVDLEMQIRQAQLGMLIEGVRFESEMEKQIFMAVNLARHNPKAWQQYVMFVKNHNPTAKALFDHSLNHHLKNMHKLPPIHWDDQAARACREQNQKVAGLATIPDGGSMLLYNGFLGAPQICEEFTQRNFNDQSGAHFVAMQMIVNWARQGPGHHKCPILDLATKKMGCNTALSQFHTNVTNALYVKAEGPVAVVAPAPVAMAPQVVVAAPVAVIEAPRVGMLKAKLQHAQLVHHHGPPLHKMSPKVRVYLPDFEWVSVPQEHGGKDVNWGPMARFEYRVHDPNMMARIEVLDHRGLLNNEPIGHCEVRIGELVNRREAAFELFFRTMPAGQIFFHTEFFPEAVAVVAPAPVMVAPVQPMMAPAPVVVQQPAPMMAPVAVVRQGQMKAHLKRAELQHHEGPPLEEMSPKVRVIFPDYEWVSDPKERAGRDPEWGPFAHFEYHIRDPEARVRIEVVDHAGLMNNEPIGHCEVRLGDFMDRQQLTFELFFRTFNAGRIHFHAEFFPQDAVVAAAPMQPVMAPVVVEQPRPVEVAVVNPVGAVIADGGRPGWLKMHLKEVHVEFHAGPPLERMSPQVHIRHGDFAWKSNPKEHAGHNAHWEMAQTDFEVIDHHREVVIEVRDHMAPLENEPLGIHRCEVGFFATRGEWEDWLPLHLREFPAGRIHFKTSFRVN